LEVRGIDLSSAMVARLRAKPGGDRIPVAIGDFATARVEGTFSLAYLVFNTINNLVTQDAQVACFENVAAHLEPGGHFVIEVDVPQLQRVRVQRRGVALGLDPVPLRLAVRARSDGAAGGHGTRRPLGRLAPRAVHLR
jgi:SAM-dependent methyltransferase